MMKTVTTKGFAVMMALACVNQDGKMKWTAQVRTIIILSSIPDKIKFIQKAPSSDFLHQNEVKSHYLVQSTFSIEWKQS